MIRGEPVPDHGCLPVEFVRLAMEGVFVDPSHERLDDGVVDGGGRQAFGARVVAEAGEADSMTLRLQPAPQGAPGLGQLFRGPLDGLQPARCDRRQEVGADIGEPLGADPHGGRVDGVQALADGDHVQGDASASSPMIPQKQETAELRSRIRVAASVAEPFTASQTSANVKDFSFCWGWVTGFLSFNMAASGQARSGAVSGGQGLPGGDIREDYHEKDGTFLGR